MRTRRYGLAERGIFLAPTANKPIAFLSCSVRQADRPLVNAIRTYVLEPMGFRCHTVGIGYSSADPPDVAIRKLLGSSDCLVGVATERHRATDRDFPDRTLSIATPYLLQETSMAFQARMPFLIFRTPGVDLQGVTQRNLYIDVAESLTAGGRPRLQCSKSLVTSALSDLKRRALARREKVAQEKLKQGGTTLLATTGALFVVGKAIERLSRPECFGEFYYADVECKVCEVRQKCKAEKQAGSG